MLSFILMIIFGISMSCGCIFFIRQNDEDNFKEKIAELIMLVSLICLFVALQLHI